MLRLSRSSNGVCSCSQIPHVCFLEASRINVLRQYIVSLLTHTLLALKSTFAKKKFGWHQVQIRFSWSHPCLPWAGPLVSLTGAAPSDHTFTLQCFSEYRPHRPYFLLCTVFRVLPVDASQYNFFCMHMKYLYLKYSQKHCSNISLWIDGLSFSPGWLNVYKWLRVFFN